MSSTPRAKLKGSYKQLLGYYLVRRLLGDFQWHTHYIEATMLQAFMFGAHYKPKLNFGSTVYYLETHQEPPSREFEW